jgi:DNA-binding YbaB/EbfC family protein
MSGMPDLSSLLGQAVEMQKRMAEASERLGELTAEGAAGGGLVKVTANGRREVVAVKIDPAALADGDVEMLEDLLGAAATVALETAGRLAEEQMRSAAGGLPPGGMDLGRIGKLLGGLG